MLKTRSSAVKEKPSLSHAGRFKIAPPSKTAKVRKFSSSASVAREQRLRALIQGLKSQITRLTDYIANETLPREESLFFISQLHTLNILRDKLELMKAGTSKEDLTKISRHLGKKMQSSFSD